MTAPSADDPLPEEAAPAPPSKMRGLWSVMQSTDAPVESAADEPNPSEEPAETVKIPAGPRGLWAVMRDSSANPPTENTPETVDVDAELEPFELVDDGETSETRTDEPESEEPVVSIAPEQVAEDALGDEFVFEPDVVVASPSRGWQALLLGLTALPLSAAAWFGLLWLSILTAACGFGALVLAAAEWTATGSINRRERWKVSFGGVAGALALVLGPYVFSPLGNAQRELRSGRNTPLHLQRMGLAIGQYQQTQASFPIGGTILRDREGRARGGHSWMTAILPHLGEQRLFNQIDLSQAYDEPVNRPAMSQPVTGYFAAGGSRAPNGGGLAVAHFSGVGGDVKTTRGEKLPAGVFRAGQTITADDVTDGLASTLMAGELAGRYPAWGDPENFRTPGTGLNKDSGGFGNAARTGAWLLFADGHAKFFPNETDAEVLRRLATRNAGDLTATVE